MRVFFLAVFGTIWKIISLIFSGIFHLLAKIITSLNLSLPFFYCLIGLLLYLAGGMLKTGSASFYVFHIGLVFVALTSLALTYRKLTASKRKTEREKVPYDYMRHIPKEPIAVFRVRENPDFIVYEFYDRYQLFHEDKRGALEYVRTDYKDRPDTPPEPEPPGEYSRRSANDLGSLRFEYRDSEKYYR